MMATVYLKSRTGRSLLPGGSAAPSDPGPFLPTPETVASAVAELRRRGFTIEGEGATLSISGTQELFETECGVRITVDEEMGWRGSEPVMHIAGLEDLVDGIVPAVPGRHFQRPG